LEELISSQVPNIPQRQKFGEPGETLLHVLLQHRQYDRPSTGSEVEKMSRLPIWKVMTARLRKLIG
jgi:hypothetical protein